MQMCQTQVASFYKVLIILEIIGHTLTIADTNVYQIFSDLANEHFSNCVQELVNHDCCGFCNNNQFCSNSGTCCLGFYYDFEDALSSHASNIDECIWPKISRTSSYKYYVQEDMQPILIHTKCSPELREEIDQLTIDLCENPGLNYGIDSQVPVTGLEDYSYRNMYCAQCNYDKDAHDYIFWDLYIQCANTITFNRENILHVLEENECDVYLKIPATVRTVQTCSALPEFTISTCNVTGLWTNYNRSIEVACNSFTDPFNQTFRNYFCYLCNVDTPLPRDQRACPWPTNLQQSGLEAPFAFTVTYDMITSLQPDVSLNCHPKKQFKDLKKLVCRDLRCNGVDYDSMTCREQRGLFAGYCWLGFLKFTFDRRQFFVEHNLNIDELLDVFYGNLTFNLLEDSFKDVRLYIKEVDHGGISVVDYIVVQFYVIADFKPFVNRLHRRFCPLGYSNEIAYCEFEVYEPTNNANAVFSVTNIDSTADTLRPIGITKELVITDICDNKSVRIINKLMLCVHIELREDEFDMEFRNTFLVIKENSLEFTFSRWEYEQIQNGIKLCLDDYLTIYKSMDRIRQTGDETDHMNSDLTNGKLNYLSTSYFGLALGLLLFNSVMQNI